MTKRYRDLSDSQANAEALARRDAPWTATSAQSFAVAWDWRKRAPRSLGEAVTMVRALYAAEVPTKLHEAAIGEDGTPRMTPRAEGYIFGDPRSDDAGRWEEPLTDDAGQPVKGDDGKPVMVTRRDPIGHYHAPFRARLAGMEHGGELDRHRAAIVSHVTIGSQGPVQAAMAESVPQWCAKLVAEDALFAFLHGMSDLRLHLPLRENEVDVLPRSETAA